MVLGPASQYGIRVGHWRRSWHQQHCWQCCVWCTDPPGGGGHHPPHHRTLPHLRPHWRYEGEKCLFHQSVVQPHGCHSNHSAPPVLQCICVWDNELHGQALQRHCNTDHPTDPPMQGVREQVSSVGELCGAVCCPLMASHDAPLCPAPSVCAVQRAVPSTARYWCTSLEVPACWL